MFTAYKAGIENEVLYYTTENYTPLVGAITVDAKHWSTLRFSADFAADAIKDWGVITAKDVSILRLTFPNLPARPSCSKPKILFKPNLRISSMQAFLIELKGRMEIKMGIYSRKLADGSIEAMTSKPDSKAPGGGTFITPGKWIPCTTIGMLEAVYNWVWHQNTKVSAYKDSSWQMTAFQTYFNRADILLKTEAKKRNIDWGTLEYEEMALAIVLPYSFVNGFWQLCLRIANEVDNKNVGKRTFWNKVIDFSDSAWDVTKEYARKGYQVVKKAVSWTWEKVKWIIIAIGAVLLFFWILA